MVLYGVPRRPLILHRRLPRQLSQPVHGWISSSLPSAIFLGIIRVSQKTPGHGDEIDLAFPEYFLPKIRIEFAHNGDRNGYGALDSCGCRNIGAHAKIACIIFFRKRLDRYGRLRIEERIGKIGAHVIAQEVASDLNGIGARCLQAFGDFPRVLMSQALAVRNADALAHFNAIHDDGNREVLSQRAF